MQATPQKASDLESTSRSRTIRSIALLARLFVTLAVVAILQYKRGLRTWVRTLPIQVLA